MKKIEIQEIIIKDVKKDTRALYYAFKYLPQIDDIITTEFLEEVIRVKKFAIQYIPEELITDNMLWTIIKAKDPRYLKHIPRERLSKEMHDMIIETFTSTGLQSYLDYMNDILDINIIKRVISHTAKSHRQYLLKHIPVGIINDEILELIGHVSYSYTPNGMKVKIKGL